MATLPDNPESEPREPYTRDHQTLQRSDRGCEMVDENQEGVDKNQALRLRDSLISDQATKQFDEINASLRQDCSYGAGRDLDHEHAHD